jgi:hypothetical protein
VSSGLIKFSNFNTRYLSGDIWGGFAAAAGPVALAAIWRFIKKARGQK